MTRDVHQELIDKFKDEPFSIIDKQGTILNKTHLSSMGYATHVPYSVVGLWDLLTSINKLAHKKEDLEKENKLLKKENKELKFQNEDLLHQIGKAGKNNKTCRECECFVSETKYCYMWDMEVEADDVVVACDQRKVKNTNEVMEND